MTRLSISLIQEVVVCFICVLGIRIQRTDYEQWAACERVIVLVLVVIVVGAPLTGVFFSCLFFLDDVVAKGAIEE